MSGCQGEIATPAGTMMGGSGKIAAFSVSGA